jgi:radical SAM protein with 4Fe4S-binding SPASM domain
LNAPTKYLFDGCKLLWHQDKLQDYLDGKRISPILIDMGIHKSCNIRCIYCYGIKQKPSPKYIPEERLLLLAKDAKDAGVRALAIIGDGEPTMNKGLYPFVSYAHMIALDVGVATNGLLLDEEKVKILTNSCIWLRFNISAIDKYDYIMGAKNGLAKFDKVIKWAVKHKGKCTIGLQAVLIPEGFTEVIPLAQAALDWGVDYLVIKQFSDPEEGIPVKFDMDEYDKATSRLRVAEEMSNEKTKIIVKWGAITDSRSITKHKHWDFSRCIDLPFIFQISGDGGCYPCGYLFGDSRYCYGNVISQTLTEILVSKRYWSVIDTIKHMKLKDLCKGQCRHCETNKFMDRLLKREEPYLEELLVGMCGGRDIYKRLMSNPPEHKNFV